MKRCLFGMLLAAAGLGFSLFSFADAVWHPGTFNGIDGLLGSLLYRDTLMPFALASGVALLGMVLCGLEAYRRK